MSRPKLTPACRVCVGHQLDLGDGDVVRVIGTSRVAYTISIDEVQQPVDQVTLQWIWSTGRTGGRVCGPHDPFNVVG